MKKILLLLFLALVTGLAVGAQTFSVECNGNQFNIKRSGSNLPAQTVRYRTVSLSAIAGTHFTDASDVLTFAEGDTLKTVTVTETPVGSIAAEYRYQANDRKYRFVVVDNGGFELAHCDRILSYGTTYMLYDTYMNKSVTDLVYFNNSGSIMSGTGNKYLDVSYSSSSWTQVTDGGYSQAVHTVSTGSLFNNSTNLRSYLNSLGYKMYATVYFTQKEEQDGYQYIQILADNASTHDGNDPNGAVNDPSKSLYKACFILSYDPSGSVMSDAHYQFFPHRYDYVDKAAETSAGITHYEFDYDNSHLYQQKYKASSYNAANNGALSLATTVNNLNIRFDAAGSGGDTWDFKDLKVRLALVDANAPTLLNNFKVSGGRHARGNTIYVTVPFNETVKVNGKPTLSTSWGSLTYVEGSGTNALTYSGEISDNASGTFIVYGSSGGTISDMSGNTFASSISYNFGTVLDDDYAYSITYDLDGGTLETPNPSQYTYYTETFTLNNPTKPIYIFEGWTGSNGNTPQTAVVIDQGTTGDLHFTANWTLMPRYTFDSETGALALNWGEFNKDNKWGSEVTASAVKSVIATSDVSFTGDCSELFYGFGNCESMDLSNVNTDSVTSMNRMFYWCLNLTTLDLSGWNTGNVTNMAQMFSYCRSLGSLDLSGWNTGNVTDMGYMFYDCWGLGSLDVSGWNTGSVTNMGDMFNSCSALTSLDVSGFNTGNVTNMEDMFYNCPTLTSLDLSGFNTANVTGMGAMFRGCSGLTSLDLSGFNTGNVADMRDMFSNCSALISLDLSGWNTGNVTYMSYMFYQCWSLNTLDVSGWNTGNVTDMSYMFYQCWSLNTLDVSGWNTGNVTDMSYMFYNCSALTTLDLSGFDTENVTDMNNMFSECHTLISLDLSNFDTGNVTDMNQMFYKCSNLTTIYAGTGWSTESVEESYEMFAGCRSLVGGMGTTYDSYHKDKEYARIDRGADEPGYLTGMFSLTLSENVTATPAAALTHGDVSYYAAGTAITLSYSGEIPENCHFNGFTVNGTAIDGDTFEMPFEDVTVIALVLPRYTFDSETGALALNWGEFNKDNKWSSEVTASAVKSVTATSDVSFTGDCSELFRVFNNCESMDLGSVNTDSVTNMSHMFYWCPNLTSLDLSGWNTANVTDMSYMFFECKGLTSLDVSGFNTANVTDMSHMFSGCSGLTSLDVSGFNTKNVTNMRYMFDGCSHLTSLDVSGFNTGNVTNLSSMFDGCSGLTSLDVSGFNTGNVTRMYSMFDGCSHLTSLDVSGFNTDNVTFMNFMFCGCKSLTSLDVSGFNTANVTDMRAMFNTCSGLTSLDLSGFNTGNVIDMSYMFNYCSGLTSLDLSGWNTGSITDMSYMFRECSALISLDLSGWNTENVFSMCEMFSKCSALTTLDLSGFNTGNVEDMSYMFYNCSDMTTIYAGTEWSTESVEESYGMFTGCQSLVGGMGTVYDADHVDAEYAHIDGGPDCPGYFTTAPQGVPGDVNGDGYVTSADVTELYNYLLNGDETYLDYCDVNGDGSITSADITAVYSILLGSKGGIHSDN